MSPSRYPYKEGTVFAVPLRNGGFALGVVSRTAPRGKILFAYLFGPALDSVPSISKVQGLQPQHALRVARMGDLSLVENTWPVIGEMADWNRSEWPVPELVRRDGLARKAWLVTYADDDASRVVSEERIAYAAASEFERDGLLGAGAVEILMTKLLSRD